MTATLASAWPYALTAFAASAVEVVEAFTIVLAVAVLRGWRPAVAGTAGALAILALLVLMLGPALAVVPLWALQLVVGLLLLLMGLGWLRKAALRAAGVIPLHDEAAIFVYAEEALRRQAAQDWLAGLAAFKAVLLEGLEVVFIVIAVGAGRGMLGWASLGAAAACVLVLLFGMVLRRPLTQVPENTLKFGVGVMLTAFGTFWTAEGLGLGWPGGDLALPVLALFYLSVGLASARMASVAP